MFLLVFLVTATAAAAALLYLKWMRVRNYWANLGVPANQPHPLYGSLSFLMKRNIIEWMMDEYAQFKDRPYFGVWLFWRPTLIVRSPEIAKRILVKDFDNFRNRLLRSGKSDPLGGLNVLTVLEPIWSSVRRYLTTFFSSAKLKSQHSVSLQKSKEIVQRIKNEKLKAPGKATDLRNIFACYTTDLISAAAFGLAGDSTLTDESPMRSITRDMMKFTYWRSFSWCSIFFFPELVDIFRFKMYSPFSTDYFRKIFRMVMSDRETNPSALEHRDLIGILIKMKKEASESGKELSEDFLLAQSAIMLLGGFDTTAVSLTWTMYELAYNPEAQEKLYNEIVTTKRDILHGEDFNPTVLKDMVYLNAVMKEGVRKYPNMGWLDRIAASDYKVDENLTITAGTPVYICTAGMHRDPEFFPNPLIFDPDRFLPENEANIVPFSYMPFGDGPRSCIGQRFAKQTIQYVMAHIVESFELRPLPGAPLPKDLKVDTQGVLMTPQEPLYLDFVLRK